MSLFFFCSKFLLPFDFHLSIIIANNIFLAEKLRVKNKSQMASKKCNFFRFLKVGKVGNLLQEICQVN